MDTTEICKNQENSEETEKDKSGRKSPNRETPPFETHLSTVSPH